MSKHTPTPWKANLDGMDALVICPDGRSFNIGDIVYHDDNKANALFVVRACNSFDDLLAACKAVAGVFEGHEDVPVYVARCRAAVAKAEGRRVLAPESDRQAGGQVTWTLRH